MTSQLSASPISHRTLWATSFSSTFPKLTTKSPQEKLSATYGAWIIKVNNITDTEELMGAAAYEEFCNTEA